MANELAINPQQDLDRAGIGLDTIRKYIYEFKQGKEDVADLTAEAVNHIAEYMGISTESLSIISEDDDQITVQAVAVKGDIRHVAIVRQAKKDASGKAMPYAVENAVSKSQRNAKKALLPMPQIRDYIKKVRDPSYNPAEDSSVQLRAANERLEKAKAVYLDQQETIKEMTVEAGKLRTDLEVARVRNKELAESNKQLQEGSNRQSEEDEIVQYPDEEVENNDPEEDQIDLI